MRGGFGFSPFFLELPWYFFRFRCMQVKPQKRKELCDGREGQTAYYVERKALRCGARKATLLRPQGRLMVPWSTAIKYIVCNTLGRMYPFVGT